MRTNSLFRLPLFLLLFAAALLLSRCSKSDSPTSPGPGDTGSVADTVRPVVFVHGRLGAADTWTWMIQYFRYNGYPRNYLQPMDLQNMYTGSFAQCDIPGMATQIDNFVTSVCAQTGWQRIDIVAHDMGAQAVQYYLTRKGGTSKIAHFVSCGGIIDPSLTSAGSLTPGPVKYRTIRGDGTDGTQQSPDDGSMTGADNQQLPGLDHQRLVSHESAFKLVYAFCTGTAAKTASFPLNGYNNLSGKVITFWDNTPVPNAQVTIFNVDKTNGSRSIGGYPPVTTDADGNWGPIQVDKYKMVEIYVTVAGYQDMHDYRQTYRDSTFTERVRMIPRSGGSALLQNFAAAFDTSFRSSGVFMHSPNRALYADGSLNARIGGVTLLNGSTAPRAKNLTWMFCFDEHKDGQNGSAPMSNPILNAFGISSYDIFLPALPAGQTIPTDITVGSGGNPNVVNARNWKTNGPANNTGVSVVRYDNWN